VTSHAYIRAVRQLYQHLPHTYGQFSRSDRQLAADLFRRQIPFDTLRAAMLLTIARRLYRNGPPLPVIRSLYYFLPALDEILKQPLPRGYIQYLENKIAAFNNTAIQTAFSE
jgi:hypothetical protein